MVAESAANPDAVPLVELSELTVRLNRSTILRHLDLVVAPGEAVGIVGANGSGKTTLLRVVATLLAPTEGTAKILGAEGRALGPTIRRQIELIGHRPALYPELSLRENLSLVARLTGHSEDAVDDRLAAVGLAAAADRRADRASHGMQRRVEFARALLRSPRLLLLDEAHAGLDKHAQALVAHVARAVVGRDGAVVVVSHEPNRMSEFVTRVHRLEDGHLEDGAAYA